MSEIQLSSFSVRLDRHVETQSSWIVVRDTIDDDLNMEIHVLRGDAEQLATVFKHYAEHGTLPEQKEQP